MRFWFEHSSEVSLREQLVAQVTLGILSGELAPGERLPSIRLLARRFDLHANTVSAGYKQLEADGWVASRKGSGVFVRTTPPPATERGAAVNVLDRLVSNLFDATRRIGLPDAEVHERVRAFSQRVQIDKILLVEPDPELRRIVIAELAEHVTLPIEGCGLDQIASTAPGTSLAGALLVTLPSKLDRVKAGAPASRVEVLRVRSVPASLAEHLPPPSARAGVLVGIASRWPDFLRFARTMLVAAGVPPDALVVRDAREPLWRDGLAHTAAIVCDLVTANKLANPKTIVSRVLADNVPQELNALIGSRIS